jgi:hypothetical protein
VDRHVKVCRFSARLSVYRVHHPPSDNYCSTQAELMPETLAHESIAGKCGIIFVSMQERARALQHVHQFAGVHHKTGGAILVPQVCP